MATKLPPKDKEYLLSLTPDDITFELFVELLGKRSKIVDGKMRVIEPKMKMYAEFDLAPNEYFNKSKVTTTVGEFLVNKFIVEEELQDVLGYINKTIDGGQLKKMDSTMAKALLNDKIDTKVFARYLDKMQWLSLQLHTVVCGSFTMATLKPNPKVVKERERLFKEYKDALESGDAIIGAKIEQQLIDVAKQDLAGDHGLDLYNSGARGSFGNNYKNIAIMRGPTINPSTGKFDVSKSSYMEGIRKDELHIFGNSIVSGAFPKAIGTATSGYFSKQIMAAQQAITTDAVGSDCKSLKTIQVKLTSDNSKDYAYRFIKDGGKLVCLDDETMPKYIGKTVQMRSVKYCTSPNGKICYTCTGKLFYLLNIRNTGLTSSRVASTLLNLSMKKFHDPSIKLYTIKLSDMMLSDTFKSAVKESQEIDMDELIKEMEEEMNYEEEIVMEAKYPAKSSLGFYHASPITNLSKINATPVGAYPSLGAVVFASQSKSFATCFGGEWSEEHASIDIVHGRMDDNYSVSDIKHIIFSYDPNFVDVNKPASLYKVAGIFNHLSYDGDPEVVCNKDTRVLSEEYYSSWKEMMEKNGVKLNPMSF